MKFKLREDGVFSSSGVAPPIKVKRQAWTLVCVVFFSLPLYLQPTSCLLAVHFLSTWVLAVGWGVTQVVSLAVSVAQLATGVYQALGFTYMYTYHTEAFSCGPDLLVTQDSCIPAVASD